MTEVGARQSVPFVVQNLAGQGEHDDIVKKNRVVEISGRRTTLMRKTGHR